MNALLKLICKNSVIAYTVTKLRLRIEDGTLFAEFKNNEKILLSLKEGL
jgi:hypothetical protein